MPASTLERVFVALGSNVGDRAAHLAFARERLAALLDTRLVAVSRVEERMAGTVLLSRLPPLLFRRGAGRSSSINTKGLRDRSARLRSRRSARRNIGSGRSPFASCADPFLDATENRDLKLK